MDHYQTWSIIKHGSSLSTTSHCLLIKVPKLSNKFTAVNHSKNVLYFSAYYCIYINVLLYFKNMHVQSDAITWQTHLFHMMMMMMMVYYRNYTFIEIMAISYCKSFYHEGVKPQVADVPSNTCNTYIIIFHGARSQNRTQNKQVHVYSNSVKKNS